MQISHNLECFPDSSKHYLLDFNWHGAITQCTHPVNVLSTKLGIKIDSPVSVFLRGGAWHSYSCSQTVGWIKMPLGKGPCIIVLMLRISCVSEKGDFLQKYCALDNIVCALCRHQAETELVSLET